MSIQIRRPQESRPTADHPRAGEEQPALTTHQEASLSLPGSHEANLDTFRELSDLLQTMRAVLHGVELVASLARESEPPRLASFLFALIPAKHRECVVGDIEEEFRMKILPKYGRRQACVWYWTEVMMSASAFLYQTVAAVVRLTYPRTW